MYYDAFICYRGDGSGGEFANRLYDELSKNRYLKIFFAPRSVSHGHNFLETVDTVMPKISVVILVLSKNFFANCKEDDDIVAHELKVASKQPGISFLPITLPGFNYMEEDLSTFSLEEIARFKHQSAIPYSGIYDTYISHNILSALENLLEHGQDIQALKNRNRNRYRDASAEKERSFLKLQAEMLYDFDEEIYRKFNLKQCNILDVGCNDGTNMMERFKKGHKTLIGIDRDEDCVLNANKNYSCDDVSFYVVDIESQEFDDNLFEIERQNSLTGFDFINVSMVLLHTEKPFNILKILRKHLGQGGIIFIRDIDDDFNFSFPDDEKIFHHLTEICSYCDILGYRKSGKEIYTYLSRAGFRDVRIEKAGLNTSCMTFDEKEALFDVYYGYIPTALEKTIERNPDNLKIKKDYEWVCESIEKANQLFHQNDFVFSLGYIIYTAMR